MDNQSDYEIAMQAESMPHRDADPLPDHQSLLSMKMEQLMQEPKTDAEYSVDDKHCPVCNSMWLGTSGRPQRNGSKMYKQCQCFHCGAAWTDVYHLLGYIDLKDKDGKIITRENY